MGNGARWKVREKKPVGRHGVVDRHTIRTSHDQRPQRKTKEEKKKTTQLDSALDRLLGIIIIIMVLISRAGLLGATA
jgi:hypothetical protein